MWAACLLPDSSKGRTDWSIPHVPFTTDAACSSWVVTLLMLMLVMIMVGTMAVVMTTMMVLVIVVWH